MKLTAIKAGDIVRVGGNLHALVLEKRSRQLVITGLCNNSIRRVRAGEIERHWRQSRSR